MVPLCRAELEVLIPMPEGALDVAHAMPADNAQSRAAAAKVHNGAGAMGKNGAGRKNSVADAWRGVGSSLIDRDRDIIKVPLDSLLPLAVDVGSGRGAGEAANLFLCETSILEADDVCIVLAGPSPPTVSFCMESLPPP